VPPLVVATAVAAAGAMAVAVAVAEAASAQSSSSSLVIVVILFLLDRPPCRHCPSPFCHPQLFLQAAAHPPSTLLSMVGCCVGAPTSTDDRCKSNLRSPSMSSLFIFIALLLLAWGASLVGRCPRGGRRTTMTAIARMTATDLPLNCLSLSHLSLAATVVTSSPNCT
jgi:hypothetical protein